MVFEDGVQTFGFELARDLLESANVCFGVMAQSAWPAKDYRRSKSHMHMIRCSDLELFGAGACDGKTDQLREANDGARIRAEQIVKFVLDLNVGTLSVYGTGEEGKETQVQIFRGLNGPLIPVVCMFADKVTVNIHDLSAAEEGRDNTWLRNFSKVITAMDNLAAGDPIPHSLVVEAWLDHREEVEEKPRDDLLAAVQCDFETSHPLVNQERQTMMVKLDGADGMVLEFDDRSTLPAGYGVKITLDKAGNAEVGASGGVAAVEQINWLFDDGEGSDSSTGTCSNNNQTFTNHITGEFTRFFTEYITVGKHYRIVFDVTKSDSYTYLGCGHANLRRDNQSDNSLRFLMGGRNNGYHVKIGTSEAKIRGSEVSLKGQPWQRGDRITYDFVLEGEGANVFTISKGHADALEMVHEFDLEGDEWAPAISFYPDSSGNTSVSVIQEECFVKPVGKAAAKSAGSSKPAGDSRVMKAVSGLIQEVPAGNTCYIQYPVCTPLTWRETPEMVRSKQDSSPMCHVEDSGGRCVWASGTSQEGDNNQLARSCSMAYSHGALDAEYDSYTEVAFRITQGYNAGKDASFDIDLEDKIVVGLAPKSLLSGTQQDASHASVQLFNAPGPVVKCQVVKADYLRSDPVHNAEAVGKVEKGDLVYIVSASKSLSEWHPVVGVEGHATAWLQCKPDGGEPNVKPISAQKLGDHAPALIEHTWDNQGSLRVKFSEQNTLITSTSPNSDAPVSHQVSIGGVFVEDLDPSIVPEHLRGLLLHNIAGEDVVGARFADVAAKLEAHAERPLTLGFVAPSTDHSITAAWWQSARGETNIQLTVNGTMLNRVSYDNTDNDREGSRVFMMSVDLEGMSPLHQRFREFDVSDDEQDALMAEQLVATPAGQAVVVFYVSKKAFEPSPALRSALEMCGAGTEIFDVPESYATPEDEADAAEHGAFYGFTMIGAAGQGMGKGWESAQKLCQYKCIADTADHSPACANNRSAWFGKASASVHELRSQACVMPSFCRSLNVRNSIAAAPTELLTPSVTNCEFSALQARNLPALVDELQKHPLTSNGVLSWASDGVISSNGVVDVAPSAEEFLADHNVAAGLKSNNVADRAEALAALSRLPERMLGKLVLQGLEVWTQGGFKGMELADTSGLLIKAEAVVDHTWYDSGSLGLTLMEQTMRDNADIKVEAAKPDEKYIAGTREHSAARFFMALDKECKVGVQAQAHLLMHCYPYMLPCLLSAHILLSCVAAVFVAQADACWCHRVLWRRAMARALQTSCKRTTQMEMESLLSKNGLLVF